MELLQHTSGGLSPPCLRLTPRSKASSLASSSRDLSASSLSSSADALTCSKLHRFTPGKPFQGRRCWQASDLRCPEEPLHDRIFLHRISIVISAGLNVDVWQLIAEIRHDLFCGLRFLIAGQRPILAIRNASLPASFAITICSDYDCICKHRYKGLSLPHQVHIHATGDLAVYGLCRWRWSLQQTTVLSSQLGKDNTSKNGVPSD